MTSESENPLNGGNDDAQPSSEIDNPKTWDYFDPDDDQDKEKKQAAKGTEGETAESADGAQEAVGSEPGETPEGEEESQEGEKPEAPSDDVTVKMPDGASLTLAELKQGYFRQADYSRKTNALAQERSEVHAMATKLHNDMRAVSAFLQSTLPPPPDPQLAVSDPASFIAMKAQYDDAMAKLQEAQAYAHQPQQVLSAVDQRQYQNFLEHEKQRMVQAMPQLATEEGVKKFLDKAVEVGSLFGISREEMMAVDDHRHLLVLDLAIEGLAARNARKVAKSKVAGVPPVVPNKQRPSNSAASMNKEAMRKLARSGSMKDAMLVDFE